MKSDEFLCDCNVIHEEIVNTLREQMPNMEIFNFLADFFKILGDSTRTKMIFALDKHEMCVCDIANLLGMTKSSISHQLATLRKMKIVKYRKVSKTVYYSLDDEHVNQVFELGLKHIYHKLDEKRDFDEKNL